jgi:hypothetical protein
MRQSTISRAPTVVLERCAHAREARQLPAAGTIPKPPILQAISKTLFTWNLVPDPSEDRSPHRIAELNGTSKLPSVDRLRRRDDL